MKEFNNADIRFYVAVKDYERLNTMYEATDANEIIMNCSPLHVQSVLEDMQGVILSLLSDLRKKENQQ